MPRRFFLEEVIGMWNANTIRQWAENQRRSVSFTPDHPAVKAARRYCERTGRTWHIGIGGRCELGKRAIKQWLYEWSRPLVKAWRTWLRLTLFILLIVGSLLLALFGSWVLTLSVFGGLAAIFVAVIAGTWGHLLAEDGKSLRELWSVSREDESPVVHWLAVTAVIVGTPVALIVYGITRLFQQRVVRSILKRVFLSVIGLIVAVLVVALAVQIVLAVLAYPWQALWVVVMFASSALVVGGVLFGGRRLVEGVADARESKLKAIYAAERANTQTVDTAYEKLKPLLADAFKEVELSLRVRKIEGGYDAWVKAFATELAKNGLAWTDVARYEPGTEYDLRKRFGWLQDAKEVFPYYYEYLTFMERLREWQLAQLPSRKQRWVRTKQVVSFVAATVFLLKSKVCPNVELPDWDAVQATKS